MFIIGKQILIGSNGIKQEITKLKSEYILSYNTFKGIFVNAPISEMYSLPLDNIATSAKIIRITVKDNFDIKKSIDVFENTKIYTKNNGYIAAGYLNQTDLILDATGKINQLINKKLIEYDKLHPCIDITMVYSDNICVNDFIIGVY